GLRLALLSRFGIPAVDRNTEDRWAGLPAPARPSGATAGRGSAVEPEILEPKPVVDAVDYHGHSLHQRVPARRLTGIEDNGAGAVLGQTLLDFPHQPPALFLVGFRGLLVDHLIDLGAAIAGVVAFGRAG